MKPYLKEFEMAFANLRFEEKWNWHTCLHEAAHAVVHIRYGGIVDYVEVQGAFMRADRPAGITHLHPFQPSDAIAVAVAGHFAEKKWGNRPIGSAWNDKEGEGSADDFESLCRFGEDFARKVWRQGIRELHTLANRDPLFEQQVKAVAKALSQQEKLTGGEVVAVMAARS
jgi:hypothetical protein